MKTFVFCEEDVMVLVTALEQFNNAEVWDDYGFEPEHVTGLLERMAHVIMRNAQEDDGQYIV